MNILKNIYSLFKLLINKNKIDWYYTTCVIENCIIDKQAKVYGTHHLFNVTLGFGTAIGKNSSISYTSIGKFCSIGPNFLCGWGIHPINGVSINPAFYSTKKQNGFTYSETDKVEERQPIKIGNDVFIGANVTVLDGITIGDGAVIGAGAVVTKDVPPYAIAVGCPINVIKYRFSPEVITELLATKWWDQDKNTLTKVEKYFFDVPGFLESIRKKEKILNS